MSRVHFIGLTSLLVTSVLILGCTGQKSSIVSPSPRAAGPQELRSRENSHHQFALQTSSTRSMREETVRYTADMRGMMDSMMTTCMTMGSMGGGMMGGHSMEDMQRMMERMRQTVSTHESRMSGMGDMAGMRAECSTHHEQMIGMLSEMDAMMSGGHDNHHGN